MPFPCLPPDKSIINITSNQDRPTHDGITPSKHNVAPPLTIPKNDKVIDPKTFSNSLAKPCSISSRDGADNLKQVIQGKYHKNLLDNVTLSSDLEKHGPYSKQESTRIQIDSRKGGKIVTAKLFSPKEIKITTNIQLPPRPIEIPVLKPKTPQMNEYLKELPSILSKLLESTSDLHEPIFKFEVSEQAAKFNWDLLHHHNFDLQHLLNPQKRCVTNYGSEFKSSKDLEPLLALHPRWPDLKKRLDNGVDFPLLPIDETTRHQDLIHAHRRGNHKSAKIEEDHLAKAMEKEVSKGWNIILPDSKYDIIPNLILNPMGVASHCGISAFGEFIDKLRITHNLSFPGKVSEQSVNSRVSNTDQEPCMFGHTLLRVIHYIVNLRKRYPQKNIWIRKEDLKSAYRRMHLNAKSAFTSAVRVRMKQAWFILLSIRLPFGGSPCPSEFCLLSDILADLITDLLSCEHWDHRTVHSKYLQKIPEAVNLDPTIPFAQARNLIVSLPIEDQGKSDVFIDDLISVAVDINDNLNRLRAAPCTIIHAISHSSSSSPHIKRDDLIADDKNDAEGAPEERKICLGWLLDTRQLTVSLPFHKFKAWSKQISDMMKQKTVSEKLLASVLGRLENVATIMVMMGHFLSNIRYLQIQAQQRQHNIRLSQQAREDLTLCLSFLDHASKGISMNLLTFRSPDIIHIGDASEHGLGAFASHGRAWRYIIPFEVVGSGFTGWSVEK